MTPEVLHSITPASRAYTEKFSFNFAAFVKKRGVHFAERLRFFYARGGADEVWDQSKTLMHQVYVGFMDGESFLIGARLSEIVTMGRKAGHWAYPVHREFPFGLEDITERYLASYLRDGKCAFDPEHCRYFDSDRFETEADGKRRTCRFCGRVEVAKRVRKVKTETVWRVAS
jgi:hypothetical protein